MGIGFAIPVDVAKDVMEGLIKRGQVTRGWIGIEPRDLNSEIVEMLRLPDNKGVLITGVLRNGPADKAGLKPGDVVLQVAGQAVGNTAQLLARVSALTPGATASLEILRSGQKLSVAVTAQQRPTGRRLPDGN
jgi:S1-C subfamily serine protease